MTFNVVDNEHMLVTHTKPQPPSRTLPLIAMKKFDMSTLLNKGHQQSECRGTEVQRHEHWDDICLSEDEFAQRKHKHTNSTQTHQKTLNMFQHPLVNMQAACWRGFLHHLKTFGSSSESVNCLLLCTQCARSYVCVCVLKSCLRATACIHSVWDGRRIW